VVMTRSTSFMNGTMPVFSATVPMSRAACTS
jgi:hypothetical protein